MLSALVLGTAASLAPPLLAKVAIDQGIEKHDTQTLVLVVVAFLAAALLVWLMTSVQTYLVGWVGQRALADLRLRIFTHLQRQPIGFYESRPAGVLISRMTNDVEALESLVTDSVVTLFQAGLTLVGAIAVLLYLDSKLALLTFCVVPFVAALSIWFRLTSAGAFRRTRETIGAITGYLQETLSGIRVVRSFGSRADPRGSLRRAQRGQPRGQHGHRAPQRRLLPGRRNALRCGARADRPLRRAAGDRRAHQRPGPSSRSSPRSRSCSNRSSSSHSSTPPTSPAWRRSRRSSSCSMCSPSSRTAAARSSFRASRATSASRTSPSPTAPAGATPRARAVPRPPRRARSALALDDVSLHVPAGETVALVGATGAGKSTMAKLVARFYDPTSGRVLVDGHDLREIASSSLRSQMGIVPQEAFLFCGHDPREHRLRTSRGHRRAGSRSGRRGGRRRVHLRARARL